uniref:Uncharacterized protein n=1 Tax=Rhizophagus irregularis (strain DAOM 181602 / DAOM 197198 / MUCL 43194) TaxID=747089 RepID=U9TNZ2_RHIID
MRNDIDSDGLELLVSHGILNEYEDDSGVYGIGRSRLRIWYSINIRCWKSNKLSKKSIRKRIICANSMKSDKKISETINRSVEYCGTICCNILVTHISVSIP